MLKFYVYLWLREDGTPYYVGKGTGGRAYLRVQHSVHRPVSRSRIIVQEYADEQEAFDAEKFLVDFYGRIDRSTGCLRNHADGGLGGSAAENGRYKRTEEHRRFLSTIHRGNKKAIGKGRPKGKQSPEEIAKRSVAIQAWWDRRRSAQAG